MEHNHNPKHIHSHGSDQKLSVAIFINILLSVAQVIGGIVSGSLSLIADALHNFSDAGAIVVALVARRIGERHADNRMTYGYKRAEIIGVIVNSTTLIVVGLYLTYESITRLMSPQPIDGWIVIWLAGLALVVDLITALMTYLAGAKHSMNIRAAFIHNLSDAAASLVVIVSGILIILYEFYLVDVFATLLIAGYVIYHGLLLLKRSITIIMQAVPDEVAIDDIKKVLESISGVVLAKHIHVWQLDEEQFFAEVHLSLEQHCQKELKSDVRALLKAKFNIDHTTIETSMADCENCVNTANHQCHLK